MATGGFCKFVHGSEEHYRSKLLWVTIFGGISPVGEHRQIKIKRHRQEYEKVRASSKFSPGLEDGRPGNRLRQPPGLSVRPGLAVQTPNFYLDMSHLPRPRTGLDRQVKRGRGVEIQLGLGMFAPDVSMR
ncbi:hypothetical protein CEXT_518601 [Caerostris extrusa]|uniref:Uncharacterized protein n=1 Tax=Caerostris extrusa TaxID=172846 RepID=A0AAV4TVT4_CAEEX|nr:hypothetical protein CEXT_518601 [Caerostris extrusa]